MERSPAIDAFLAGLPDDFRTTLETLRRQIAAAAPEGRETIAYSVPAFTYKGRPLVSFSAGRKGQGPCALYIQSPGLMEAHHEALKAYDTSKGTIHFTPDEPLPTALVTMLVQGRMAETDRTDKR